VGATPLACGRLPNPVAGPEVPGDVVAPLIS
jgi:hypothetical protein